MLKIFFVLCSIILFINAFSQDVPLTFQVDMSHETISPDGVHVAGNFQSAAGVSSDWNPGTLPLSDNNGDEIYEVTVQVPPGSYLYKYVNGDSWGDKPELPPSDCALNDGNGNFNRLVEVGPEGTIIPVMTFDSCNTVLRLSVNMQDETISPEGVFVTGDFQEVAGLSENWTPGVVPMTDTNQDGTYEVTLPLPPGVYHYLFVNGSDLETFENTDVSCVSSVGPFGYSRKADMTTGSQEILTNCFSTCTLCDPLLNTDYDTYWWNDVVFYEIFVRSFYDSDGDGIGDFRGLTEKLDYLNDGDPDTDDDLGIGGIWLMPMMPSPTYHGYDVTDYYQVEPDYGTMEDFEHFLNEAHARGIKVIIDYVMNHTSNQHPWFQQSSQAQNNFRDWYIWKDNDPGFNGPWGQEVWHRRNNDYYYGLFWSGMPDLNYDHPPVREEMYDIARYWLEKGVDGFRLDAIKYLDEDGTLLENTSETFDILSDFHDVYKEVNPDALTVGEVWSNTSSVLPYVSENRLDLCFEFDLAYSIINAVNGQDPIGVYQQMETIQNGYRRLQYATFLTNHDIDRIFDQFGTDEKKMKLAATTYLTLPGIPFVYYGEELGLRGTGAHPNIRKPMQWTGDAAAGFTTGTPWSAPGEDYTQRNVAALTDDANSLLSHYRSLIHARNKFSSLRRGYTLFPETDRNSILAYLRIHEDDATLILSNFQNEAVVPECRLAFSTLPEGEYKLTDYLTGRDMGLITIKPGGGFEDWTCPVAIDAMQSLVIQFEAQPSSTFGADKVLEDVIKLYPNPADDFVNVIYSGERPQPSIELLDVQGRVLYTGLAFGGITRVDLSSFASGLYFLRIQSGSAAKIFSLVIQ